ncbi:MAG: hypothetical protein JJ916_05585 [Phycisphaerales bacterium]|jgi:hypothetical protein|nr:hypothetical protein [Phycisphaerales bacterium]
MLCTKLIKATLALSAITLTMTHLSGCIVGATIGGMAESYHRTGTSEIEAEYEGIAGHSFTVVVSADRLIEGNNPGIAARITQRVNDRLIQNAMPSFAIPSADLLTVLYNTPQWPAMPRGEVADMLGVERLVVVELVEYRLHEPGNKYIWDGSASCVVSVFESDSPFPDDPVFEKAIRVSFPDISGLMRTEIPEAAVNTELANRLTNRIAWLFYTHEESNVIPY